MHCHILSECQGKSFEHKSEDSISQEDLEDELESFEQITQDMCVEKTLYLFARSDREKDDWFRRFVEAAALSSCGKKSTAATREQQQGTLLDLRSASALLTEKKDEDKKADTPPATASLSRRQSKDDGAKGKEESLQDDVGFATYMVQLLYTGKPEQREVAWINAIVGRLLYDFLRNPYWANKVSKSFVISSAFILYDNAGRRLS